MFPRIGSPIMTTPVEAQAISPQTEMEDYVCDISETDAAAHLANQCSYTGIIRRAGETSTGKPAFYLSYRSELGTVIHQFFCFLDPYKVENASTHIAKTLVGLMTSLMHRQDGNVCTLLKPPLPPL